MRFKKSATNIGGMKELKKDFLRIKIDILHNDL